MSKESQLIKNTVVEQDTLTGQESYQESATQDAGVVEAMPDAGTDWEGETKKFQSMYDRSQSEINRLKKLEPIGDLLESRPDLVEVLQEKIVNPSSGSGQEAQLDENDFNPWDAYYKPESPSYRLRVKKEQETVGSAVSEIRNEFAQREAETQQRQFLNTTVNELKSKHNMDDQQVNHFLEWSAQPKEAVGLGNLVKLWKDVNSAPIQGQTSIDAVKAVQKVPPSAGVLQGQAAETVSDDNKIFDRVLNASRSGRLG
tara:strand:+ start:7834 stop:8604 length:771 start_codon:yes stop_codon:yes gene_type:complete